MVVKIGGIKPSPKPKPAPVKDEEEQAPKPKTQNKPAPKAESGGSMSFLKKGAAAKQAQSHEAAKAEARKQEQGKLWRFYLKEGEERDIIFLDGDLDEEGSLDVPMWHEHFIMLGGNWKNLPCTAAEEPCPICASGDEPSLMAGFTVLDLTPYTIKKGPNAGKEVEQSKKIFACKRTTFAQLQKIANKQGGLAGLEMNVSRSGNKTPSVGDMFMPGEKHKLSALQKQYEDDAVPADMAEEITYYTRDQLIELGVKGGEKVGGSPKKQTSEDLDNELGG